MTKRIVNSFEMVNVIISIAVDDPAAAGCSAATISSIAPRFHTWVRKIDVAFRVLH
jgi:hypothetical protein